ncbi:MAG: chemotaxis protein CheW [Desulfobacteraceae bacterium]|nr:chemotaxis protein CheW [Desulfobacteraceae bacterium]
MQEQKTDFLGDIKKRLGQLRETFDLAISLPVAKETRKLVPYLMFQLGQEQFGMPSTYILEIIVDHDIVRLPGNDGYLSGVINYRNTVLSVLDLHQMLKISIGDEFTDNILIISRGLKVNTSFMVNKLIGFVAVDENLVKPKPFSLDPSIGQLLKGEYFHQDRMVVLFNPDYLTG